MFFEVDEKRARISVGRFRLKKKRKEKQVADVSVRVVDSKDKLRVLELEYNQLYNTVYSIKSILKAFNGKSMDDELFNALSKQEATG